VVAPTGNSPVVKLQADFSGTAFGGTPTWTDITAYVLPDGDGASPITITFGRQDEDTDVTPTTVSFILVNDDGRFTPGNASSPYYPHVDVDVRIRVSVTFGGITYNRADALVDEWTVGYSDGASLVGVSATDKLGRAGQMPLQSMVIEETLLDSPVGYWTMQEIAGSVSFGDVTGKQQPAVPVYSTTPVTAGTVTSGDSQSVVDGLTVVTLADQTDSDGVALSYPVPGIASLTAFTVELWFDTAATDGTPAWPFWLFGVASTGTAQFNLQINTGATVTLTATGSQGTTATLSSVADVVDGGVHHVMASYDGTTLTLMVDTVAQTTPLAAGAIPVPVGTGFYAGNSPTFNAGLDGALMLVALYTSVLSQTRYLVHHNAGLSNLSGETTAQRMTRLASYRAGYSSQVLDTALATVGMDTLAAETLQAAYLAVGDSEGGVVFVDGSGSLDMRSRSRLFNPATALTLDASLEQITTDVTFVLSRQTVLNDVTITRTGGADQRYFDATSVAARGTYATSVALNLGSDLQALFEATWRVANNLQPRVSSPTVTIDLLTEPSTAVVAAALSLLPLDRVTLVNLPSTAPGIDGVVGGWTETLAVDQWTLQLNLTPVLHSIVEVEGDAAHGIGSTAIMAY
jgi:hypothetical protein